MRSGHPPIRPHGRLLFILAAISLVPFAGCSREYAQYNEQLKYPVRSDFVVAPGTWEIQPTAFTHPGILPLDTVTLPPTEQSPDAVKLKETVGKKLFDPNTIDAKDRAEYDSLLTEMFGTPAKPKVSGFDPETLKTAAEANELDAAITGDALVASLKLDEKSLTDGSRYFRQHCLHCHGMEGNGRGPTGPWLNPPPRDYRQGIFKFTSSAQDQNARKPRRDDIMHVLNFGIEGTSMPSFNILSDHDRETLVSYVMHLSIRGEVEYRTMYDQLRLAAESKGAAAGGDTPKFASVLREDAKGLTMKQALADNLAMTVSRWAQAQKPDKAITPAPYTYGNTDDAYLQSAARGGKIFAGTGGCIACHQNYGRESNMVYDSWGTIVRGRNLYDGVYRGGRRPVDLYNRIFGGIEGSGMTAYKDLKNSLTPQDLGITADELAKIDPLWDIVNFLRAVPYPKLRDKLRGEPYKLNLPE